MQNINKVVDLFLLFDVLDQKIREEKEGYSSDFYSGMTLRETRRTHYLVKSIDELFSEIDILLINAKEGADFLNTFYPLPDIIKSLINMGDKMFGLYHVFSKIGIENTSVSPLLIFLLLKGEENFKIKEYLNKYLPENEINYNNLIKVDGKILTGVDILNNLSYEAHDFSSVFKDETYFHNNKNFYESEQIKSILKFINTQWEDKYSKDLKLTTPILDNLSDIKLNEKIKKVFNNNVVFEDIKKYVHEHDIVFSIEKIHNVLDLLSTLNKENEIHNYLKNTLLNAKSYTISFMNIETNKQKNINEAIIREKIDSKYYNFFNTIKDCYGNNFLKEIIKNINILSDKELSTIIDIKKIGNEQLKNLPFYYLLRNKNEKTINLFIENGYTIHPLELNIINKNKKYKNLINKENIDKINNTVIEIDLPTKIKELFSNPNKSNLKELEKLLTEDKEICVNYFNEKRKDLDSKIHYSYPSETPVTKNLISSTSPVMSMILSKELDIVYTLMKSGVEFTEKEVSLLYEPFSVTKRTINNREDIDNEFLRFIKNYKKPLNNLFYNLITEGKIRDLKYGKWSANIPNIVNILFDKSYHLFQDREKLMFLDNGFKSTVNKEVSIFIYDKLPQEDKDLLYYYTQTDNEEKYFRTILKTVCQKDVNNRDYLETFFDYIGKIFINNIDNNNKDPGVYISMLKENEKEIAFMNIDLLDGLISKIEKNELTKSMNTDNVNIKYKNRL